MKLEDALNQWGLWIVTDGFITSAELNQMIESGESVQAGEVTKKAGSISLVDNSMPEYIDKIIDENCSILQRNILMVEYGGDCNGNRWNQEDAARYLRIKRNTYKTRLCEAKKSIRINSYLY
ncbi:hypothetical protein [Photobacterium profundum]|uniref:Uncharacterized protein n=1 Tax=Photobacterium profundum (strain SS9) TaxID=298386 RepID=Q6LHC7_PHOPR|nr:hypothetical protein [Photobacterium profundum]CAG23303.1 hypothetical protein PBPRB1437 [Photobacterium profundum SS9]